MHATEHDGVFRLDLPHNIASGSILHMIAGPLFTLFGGFMAYGGFATLASGGDGGGGALAMGAAGLLIGLPLCLARTSIEVSDERITAVQRYGPIATRLTLDRDDVAYLHVHDNVKAGRQPDSDGFAQLAFELTSLRLVPFARFYNQKLLARVARRFADHLAWTEVTEPGDEETPSFAAPQPAAEAHAPVPADRATVVHEDGEMVMDLPARGLHGRMAVNHRGSMFLCLASLAGFAIMIFTDLPGLALLLPLALLLASAFVLHWTWKTSRSTTTITYRDETLTVRTRTGRREVVHQWPRGAIRDVQVVKSTFSIADDGLCELKVVAGAKTKQFLRGRPDHEKQWIADEIREALGLPGRG